MATATTAATATTTAATLPPPPPHCRGARPRPAPHPSASSRHLPSSRFLSFSRSPVAPQNLWNKFRAAEAANMALNEGRTSGKNSGKVFVA